MIGSSKIRRRKLCQRECRESTAAEVVSPRHGMVRKSEYFGELIRSDF